MLSVILDRSHCKATQKWLLILRYYTVLLKFVGIKNWYEGKTLKHQMWKPGNLHIKSFTIHSIIHKDLDNCLCLSVLHNTSRRPVKVTTSINHVICIYCLRKWLGYVNRQSRRKCGGHSFVPHSFLKAFLYSCTFCPSLKLLNKEMPIEIKPSSWNIKHGTN